MKFNMKVLGVIIVMASVSSAYSMMQESDTIDTLSQRIKESDIASSERAWRENMETVNALANDKDFSGLKSLSDKVQKFGNAVLYSAHLIKNFDLMKDKIKTIDTVKKEQSEMKRFLVGQKLKSAFSFGKKEAQYKKFKQLLMDIVDILNKKIESMKKEVEIPKR